MVVVPLISEVKQAWAVAMRALFGSVLISLFLAVPVAIWFVDISRRRGKTILEERHERGAMLVDVELLHSEIDRHNHAAFEEDVAELCPGMTPAQVLKLPFQERKGRGIHHPYALAGIPYPHRMEQSHAMLLGTTGAGKTTQLRSLIAQMRQREDSGSRGSADPGPCLSEQDGR